MQCPRCHAEIFPDTEVCVCGHHFISNVSKRMFAIESNQEEQIPPVVLVALEALRNQQHHLEETIGRLLERMRSLPGGNTRDILFQEISCLDSIADVMRQALDSCLIEKKELSSHGEEDEMPKL